MIGKKMLNEQRLNKPWNKRQAIVKFKSTNKKTTTSSKKVSFASMADVVRVPNLTQEETHERWYSRKEYRSFEYDRKRTVNAFRMAINKEICLDQKRYSEVGLENQLTHHQQCQRRFRILRHNFYVLQQQYYQKCMGENDPETLQAISEMFSRNFDETDFLNDIDATCLEKTMNKIRTSEK